MTDTLVVLTTFGPLVTKVLGSDPRTSMLTVLESYGNAEHFRVDTAEVGSLPEFATLQQHVLGGECTSPSRALAVEDTPPGKCAASNPAPQCACEDVARGHREAARLLHQEKTPSFKVDPRRQCWHCFGRGQADVVGFMGCSSASACGVAKPLRCGWRYLRRVHDRLIAGKFLGGDHRNRGRQ